ncbi:MAG TPA: hypothetical protein VMC80_01950, partial [Patescibacteria group bacterium]|nr:hypothetical protein [Patescibacteria group bacterium]
MGKKLTSIVLSAALLVSGARFTFADVIAQLKSEWNPRVQKQAIEFVVEDTSKPNPIQYDFMDENGSIDKDGNAVLTEVKEKQPSKGIENQYKGNNIRTDQTTFFSAVPIKYLKGVAADCLNAYKGNSSIKGDESTLVSFKSPKSADKKDIGYAI